MFYSNLGYLAERAAELVQQLWLRVQILIWTRRTAVRHQERLRKKVRDRPAFNLN